MRAFISLELPENIKKEIVKIQKYIEKLGILKGKYTEEENLHLTLKFLGEIDEKEAERAANLLKNVKFKKFKSKLGLLGVFSEQEIRIVWIELKGEGILELQKQIDDVLSPMFPREERFMTHITVIRPKYVENRRVFLDKLKEIKFEKSEFEADSFCFKKSELNKKGAVYSDFGVFKTTD